MIKMRSLRATLALVLVAAAAPGSTLVLESRYVSCTHLLGGGVSVTCGNPGTEARRREHLLRVGEASGPGCEGMVAAGPAPTDVPVTSWVGMDPPPGPAPRATDPAVTARVNAAWDRIERWLGAHASATLRGLARPADPGDVETWEGYVRAKIPDALYASLRQGDADPEKGLWHGSLMPFASSGEPLREWHPAVTVSCELRWSDEPAPSPPPSCGG
ncbi:hypothetical protein GCM10009850_082930 [Nonomuraea monospora]|uniref:Secreted protein n=1 Tax=Nonomuraea monospora TaxID=568818 RepID=A0ABN3CU53_9ACTN